MNPLYLVKFPHSDEMARKLKEFFWEEEFTEEEFRDMTRYEGDTLILTYDDVDFELEADPNFDNNYRAQEMY